MSSTQKEQNNHEVEQTNEEFHIQIVQNQKDEIDEKAYDEEFEKANDVFIEDNDIMENISRTIDESDK